MKIDERAALADVRVLDFADQDGVVAAVVGVSGAAFQRDKRAVESREASALRQYRIAAKLIFRSESKLLRHVLLILGKDVDNKTVIFEKGIVTRRLLMDAR